MMHLPLESLKSKLWSTGRGEASSRHGSSLAGQVERTPQTLPRHYNAATSPYRRPGMATQTKTPTVQGFVPDRNM